MKTPLGWIAPFVEEMAAEGVAVHVLVVGYHHESGERGTAVLSPLDTLPLAQARLNNLRASLQEAAKEAK